MLISIVLNWKTTQLENNFFTEMCSGFEAGSYLRLIDFVYHSTLGWRVIKKKEDGRVIKKKENPEPRALNPAS